MAHMIRRLRGHAAICIAIALVAVSSLTATAHLLWGRYSLPGSASLSDVEARVLPRLQRDLSAMGLSLGSPVHIRIFKESSELEMWVRKQQGGYELFKSYPICSYSGTLGPKLKEGDRQSPEGFYTVTPEQMNPNSSYHLSFNLGFPNAFDRSHHRTGSYLMVHGNCLSIGCYAMTDAGIEEIYVLANESFKKGHGSFDVHVFPFKMTEDNLQRHSGSEWEDFWRNLKEGSDIFEETLSPPIIGVKAGRYHINPSRKTPPDEDTDRGT